MGQFSWLCRRCQLPIAGPYGLSDVNEWMGEAVVVDKNGRIRVAGEYDGYGRIDGYDLVKSGSLTDAPEIYHDACFTKHGPMERRMKSQSDPFQGMCPPLVSEPPC